MFKNKFLSTVLMSLCTVLCVMFFSTLTVEAANGTLKMEEDGKFHYYEGDRKVEDKYGFVEFDGSKFLVANGVVATDENGLAIDPDNESDWYFLSNGLAQTQHTGLVEYDGEWFYVSEGKLDTTRNAYVKYDGGLFFVAAGRLVKEYQGLAKDPNGDDWYYVADGQAQIQYTGLAGYDGEYFYVQQGKFQKEFSGSVEYDGAYFEIVEGEMTEQVYGQKMVLKSQITSNYDANNKCTSYTINKHNEKGIIYQSTVYTPMGTEIINDIYCENGNMIQRYEYDENCKKVLTRQLKYDENNNLIEQYNYMLDGSLAFHMVVTVDANGNILKEETTYGEKYGGSLEKVRNEYEYDKDGNMTKYISYVNDEKEPESWTEYQYDSNGNKIKSTNCYRGSIDSEIVYKYDSKGNQTDNIYMQGTAEEGVILYWYQYQYDENGKFTGSRRLDAEGKVLNYTVSTFFKENWLSRSEFYNGDGTLIDYTTYTYLYH